MVQFQKHKGHSSKVEIFGCNLIGGVAVEEFCIKGNEAIVFKIDLKGHVKKMVFVKNS